MLQLAGNRERTFQDHCFLQEFSSLILSENNESLNVHQITTCQLNLKRLSSLEFNFQILLPSFKIFYVHKHHINCSCNSIMIGFTIIIIKFLEMKMKIITHIIAMTSTIYAFVVIFLMSIIIIITTIIITLINIITILGFLIITTQLNYNYYYYCNYYNITV